MKNQSWRALVAGAVLCLCVHGCAARDARVEGAPPPARPDGSGPSARERVIQLSMNFRVADVVGGARTVRAAVEELGGYVASAVEEDDTSSFDARVPAEQLAALREALASLGEPTSVIEQSTDVTEGHRDLSAQLVSAHAEEARLLAMMNTSTPSLADVLSVERELTRVSATIAQLEATERGIAADVAMAHVSIRLQSDAPGFAEDPIAAIASATQTGLLVARNVAVGAAVVFAASVPTLALLIALVVLAWRSVRALNARFISR